MMDVAERDRLVGSGVQTVGAVPLLAVIALDAIHDAYRRVVAHGPQQVVADDWPRAQIRAAYDAARHADAAHERRPLLPFGFQFVLVWGRYGADGALGAQAGQIETRHPDVDHPV